jgi:hypothetical protein
MPQIWLWPFMAGTMVEDGHGVKSLPFVAAPGHNAGRDFYGAVGSRRMGVAGNNTAEQF